MELLKVNVDGLGFVIRDSSGNMIAGGACPVRSLISTEHAEILAYTKAYNFVMQQELGLMTLETCALEVKRQSKIVNVPNISRLG